jgi:hypothetical protein
MLEHSGNVPKTVDSAPDRNAWVLSGATVVKSPKPPFVGKVHAV